MLKRSDVKRAQEMVREMLKDAPFACSTLELDEMEVADFGLGRLFVEGAQIMTWVNTACVGLKIIILFENQTLPEHWHTALDGYQGKEETLRVIHGELRLFTEGPHTLQEGIFPAQSAPYYTALCEHILHASDQITLEPNTKHSFQGGKGGCILYSISSMATCARDPFTDPHVVRFSSIVEDC